MDPQLINAVLSKLCLRSYQSEAVRAFLDASRDRTGVKVVSLPTGAGKTIVGVAVAACFVAAGYTVIWTCKRWSLLRMAVAAVEHHFPDLRHQLRRIGGPS